MNFDQVHINKDLLILQCISGSRAYGLDTADSDTDIKGVYIIPKTEFYSLSVIEQVSSEKNDIVYYELRRFIELLLKNNPNLMELLNTPKKSILYINPILDRIKPELFLSKLCRQTFGEYALSQIKKAKGLNKKILNPISKERKSILDFCYIISGSCSISLQTWLQNNNLKQEECGLVNINHFKDIYALFHQSQTEEIKFKGIYTNEKSNNVLLSSVPKGISPLTIMNCNIDGYSIYCKDYKEYWEWVEKRNDVRYQNSIDNGKNYDAKNMMHTFRLLNMAEEIAIENKINVFRKDREFLLNIKTGKYLYDDLVKMANEKLEIINNLYQNCNLPELPNKNLIENLLIEMREEYYDKK